MIRSVDVLSQLLGKTVSGLVTTTNNESCPRSQLILTFTDGTSFEFWVDTGHILTASGVDKCGLDHVVDVLRRRIGTEFQVIRPPHEDPDAIQRDMLTDDGV